ncbi:hypothetical protein JZ751_027562 [Albula glossodonta]|uniref:Aromatic amino acid beta-eliminating lyase/threonine aldolase domain-containing protein n=1 Tax=Albula glossodonta TaxID=121402 RepID=A0A8T2NC71_9TELE|nr:hypothetical protein JZ751_027562 [Albula glossodonta]
MTLKTLRFSARTFLQLGNHRAKHVAQHGRPALERSTPVRLYYETAKPNPDCSVRTIDLRSDTVTKPGPAMRQAMAAAEVGDDVFGEDPTVNELQRRAADIFGMEAALFAPSGTMSNLIAVMVHCRERGDEMIVGDLSHLHIYEQGGSAQLAGVHSTTVTNLPDGTFDLCQLESKIRHGYPDAHYPRSRLVCVENTHNILGGRVLPLSFLQELRSVADQYNLAVHMDGARVMNAAVALSIDPSSGVLAAAGMVALTGMAGRLDEDHRHAKIFAQALLDCDPPLYQVDMAAVETNILRFRLCDPLLTPVEFCERMATVAEGEDRALGQGVRVLMFPHVGGSVRAVWHLGITEEDTQLAVLKLRFVAQQYAGERRRAH